MKVALVVPFHDSDGSRTEAFMKTWRILVALYPWDYLGKFHGMEPGMKFNRSRARNTGVRALDKADVVVVCDADSYPEKTPLREAIEGAFEDQKVHFPMTRIHQLNKNGHVGYYYGPSAGGCWVTTPDTWWNLGGQDERGGYSADDRPMLEVMEAFNLGPVYHPGVLRCLWHAGETRTVPAETTKLVKEYLDLCRDPVLMHKYLAANMEKRLRSSYE